MSKTWIELQGSIDKVDSRNDVLAEESQCIGRRGEDKWIIRRDTRRQMRHADAVLAALLPLPALLFAVKFIKPVV